MALLIEARRRHATKLPRGAKLATLALVALAGCALFGTGGPKEKRFAFSHRVHVVDEGLDCESCHRKAASDDDPGMPSAAQCALCHSDLDAEKPPERKVESLFEGKKFKSVHRMALGDELVFSHKAHVGREQDCAQCHVDIDKNEDVLDTPIASMDWCMQCHAQRGYADECATCHSVIREDVAPASHDRLWQQRHGRVVCERSDKTADRCSMCHNEATCVQCHLEVPPANHTNYWRMRGHGLTASMDRQNCATCHREDSCASCHAETKPLNHTGQWGAPVDRHCLSCHFPLKNEGCVVCHKGTPSHAQATPKPPDHTPAMNCRMCHGAGQPLPHVDNGDNCNLCHL